MKAKIIFGASLVAFWSIIIWIYISGNLDAQQNEKTIQLSEKSNYLPGISPEELILHASSKDCWIVIGTKVYDVTLYINTHPTPPEVLTSVCGKDATDAYSTKGGVRRKHSPHADQLLKSFEVGEIREDRTGVPKK
jgi:cytochrome b involved in lipid metabolism